MSETYLPHASGIVIAVDVVGHGPVVKVGAETKRQSKIGTIRNNAPFTID